MATYDERDRKSSLNAKADAGMEIAVVERERIFHNKRFSLEKDRAQEKYYFAIEEGVFLFQSRVEELAKGADVLEYGCSVGAGSLRLAPSVRSICGIDISDVAITMAREKAPKNAEFFTMDALNLGFKDNSFDLIFGSGIIHHLDVEAAAREVRRVLRPGGSAIFWEPLGHNPLINLYRWATPSARTADERPLLRHHIRALVDIFPHTSVRHFGLFTLAAIPLHATSLGNVVRQAFERVDRTFFAVGPCKWMSWYVLIELRA